MTPKEKAKELYDKFYPLAAYFDRGSEEPVSYEHLNKRDTKKAVSICCDEILGSEKTAYPNQHIEVGQVFKEYWQQVKEEIKKL